MKALDRLLKSQRISSSSPKNLIVIAERKTSQWQWCYRRIKNSKRYYRNTTAICHHFIWNSRHRQQQGQLMAPLLEPQRIWLYSSNNCWKNSNSTLFMAVKVRLAVVMKLCSRTKCPKCSFSTALASVLYLNGIVAQHKPQQTNDLNINHLYKKI